MSDISYSKKESGRSLLELITVLIIIAILLLAALLGFRTLLNYLKYRGTVDEVSVVATRYRLKKLQTRKTEGKVRIHDFYPEGKDCEPASKYCVATPDDGKLEVISADETSSFAVVANQLKCVSCLGIIELGNFGMVHIGELSDLDGTIELKSTYTPKKAKEVMDKICHKNRTNEPCTGDDIVGPLTFIYGDECNDADAKYFINGKCTPCDSLDKIKAPKGKKSPDSDGCCLKDDVRCGFCGGCENSTPDHDYCIDNRCVECLDDGDCTGKVKNGIKTPYCVNHVCRPCKKMNEECQDSSGAGMNMWCDYDLECKELCNHCYEPNPARPGECQLITPIGQTEGSLCTLDSTCLQCKKPMLCEAGICQCPEPKTLNEGDDCNEAICPGKCKEGLVCRDGKCKQPADCSALDADDAHRFFSKRCNTDCPCTNPSEQNFLICSDGKCACNTLPITKGASCWGECGCGATLVCSTSTTAQGSCQCKDLELDDPCTGNDSEKDCLCSNNQILSGPHAGKYPAICEGYKCVCNPEITEYTLPAGSACQEGCQQCGPNSTNPLPCINDKCGCQSDADCDQCGGEKCDTSTHTCICDPTYYERDPETGKCVCREDHNYVPWFIKTEGPHMCCPEGKIPYKVGSDYICVPICDGSGVKQIAILLDYSYSLKYREPTQYIVQNTAKEIIAAINNFNSSLTTQVKISIEREDLTGCAQGSMVCDSTVDSNRNISNGPSNQKLCACNQTFNRRSGVTQRGGTKFNEGISKITDKEHTIAILLSDGYVPDTSFDNQTFKKVIVIAQGYEGIDWGSSIGHIDFNGINTHLSTLLAESIISELCISSEDKDTLVPSQYCSAENN